MVKCPQCGTEVKQPEKTWQLISPLPDTEGRVTITVMGTFKCPNCGYRWRTKVSTLKVGPGGEVEIGGRSKRRRKKRSGEKVEGKVIEVDISDILEEEL
ncbi:MAG: chromatin protein Cren7 [Desulfurococcales archaeon ex4484_42]|nr:MAG: chromatin protein Cren7 [Desulfurococcales archaeon ex4484_42]